MYAIDSLKQLGMKFLEKRELSDFNFQLSFLQPFQRIIQKALPSRFGSSCCESWKTWFEREFKTSSLDGRPFSPSTPLPPQILLQILNNIAYSMVDEIVSTHWNLVSTFFEDIVKSFSAFCKKQRGMQQGKFAQVSAAPASMANRLAADQELLHDASGADTVVASGSSHESWMFTDSELHIRIWWPILTTMSNLILDKRSDVRHAALKTLFADVLATHGKLFSPELWRLIFKGVLFPIFDDIRHSHEEGNASTWKEIRLSMAGCRRRVKMR